MEYHNNDAYHESSTIGKRVASLRKARGETQADLAKAIKVTQSTISKLEQDFISPKASVVSDIARHYSVDINYFTSQSTLPQPRPYMQASVRPIQKQEEVRDTIELLQMLNDLKEKGAINEEEFKLLKSRIFVTEDPSSSSLP